MTVKELIERLAKLPPDLDVHVWDAEADDHVPVRDAIKEDGCTEVHIITTADQYVTSAEPES